MVQFLVFSCTCISDTFPIPDSPSSSSRVEMQPLHYLKSLLQIKHALSDPAPVSHLHISWSVKQVSQHFGSLHIRSSNGYPVIRSSLLAAATIRSALSSIAILLISWRINPLHTLHVTSNPCSSSIFFLTLQILFHNCINKFWYIFRRFFRCVSLIDALY